ncbi:hypothetical protein SAMN04488535_1023 [Corynebacterium mycetoides]|uniref:Uncharacterized protein n=2 Tax=Corynebacterium mycetoides TaxID=38302 RepID=A0A1G9NH44_9CORY|nr:hypothetical protein SAMN04488535_1023 [Corynebacterium mycetoides]
MGRMIQFVVGAAAGYVFGTKAGRKRYHQIVDASRAVANSPITKQAVTSARKALANSLDPEPRMREVEDLTSKRRLRGRKGSRADQDTTQDRIYEPDEE